uniref:Uncharacterized protein n=1 Tax=Solanum lycopersicum TaxID=4081 RepID=A0A3Q7F0L0_SOLLC
MAQCSCMHLMNSIKLFKNVFYLKLSQNRWIVHHHKNIDWFHKFFTIESIKNEE